MRLLRLGHVAFGFALALFVVPLSAIGEAGPAFAGAGGGTVTAVRTCGAALTLTVAELGDGTAVATLTAAPNAGGASALTQCTGTSAMALSSGHAPAFLVQGSWARGFAGTGFGQAIAIGPYGTGEAISVTACFGCPFSSYLTVRGTVADAATLAG